MKRIIILELCFLFLATTFQGDRVTGWVQQTIPRPDLPVKDLQFLDSLTGFMVSTKPAIDTAFIFKTTDGGNNWTTAQLINYYLTSLHFIDKNIGYCAGSHGSTAVVLKTTNGGNNWFNTSYVSSFLFLNDVVFINKDTGWVTSDFVISGGLWRTTNGGINWIMQLNDSYNPSKIFFINNNTGWVIGNSGYDLYKTTNCGVNWFLQASTSEEYYDIFFPTYDTGWIVKSIGSGTYSIIKTTNGGNNWIGVNSPIVSTLGKLFFVDGTKGWVGDRYNRLLTTRDGNIWGKQTSPVYQNYNVSFSDSLHGWAGYSGLVHTTDGGGPITYTGIRRNGEFVPAFELGQNYPNPFNPSTRIKFSIFKSCYLNLKVYNIKGQEAASLISSMGYKPGEYEINFDAEKYSLASGVYFYYMEGSTTDNKEIFVDTKKMLLVR